MFSPSYLYHYKKKVCLKLFSLYYGNICHLTKYFFIVSSGDMEDQMDFEIVGDKPEQNNKPQPARASNILELKERLEKIKSQNNYNLKNKLAKKSLNSKLNKIKKREKVKINKHKVQAVLDSENPTENKKNNVKPNVNAAKPIFNNEGKLVFSKFDFAKLGDRGLLRYNFICYIIVYGTWGKCSFPIEKHFSH